MHGFLARASARTVCLVAPLLSVLLACPTHAQTIDDGVMLAKGQLFAGSLYAHDSWDEYWEGSRKRDNGNIGTLTTQTNVWYGNYGLIDRLNIIGSVPYVWTHASQGVLHGMQGVQDVTVAGKYRLAEGGSPLGVMRAIGVLSASLPITDYLADFLPLSIGFGSRRLSARFTFNVQSEPGWYVNASTGHTWRGQVTLDRPYYYTDDQFFMTDKVDMPRVFDYAVSGGYMKHGVMATALFTQQRTLGGGDIRRQDMPFVSNRMNHSKLGGMLLYPIPKLQSLAFHVGYSYTLEGRNVGQASTVSTGLFYRVNFFGGQTQ